MKLFMEKEAEKEARLNTLMNMYLLKENADLLKKNYEDTEYEHNFLSKVKNRIVGSREYYNKYKDAQDEFNELSNKSQIVLNEDPISQITELCNDLFKDDASLEKRIMFALNYIYSLEYECTNEAVKSSFEVFSNSFGFPDKSFFENLKRTFKENWIRINLKESFNRKLALGVGIACVPLAAFAAGGLISMAAGASHATLAGLAGGAIAKGGAGVAGGIIATGLSTVAVGIGLGVATYYGKEAVDRLTLLKKFKELTPDETSYFLALNITVIEKLRKTTGIETDAYKERMSFLIEYENEIHKDFFVNGIDENNSNSDKVKMLETTFKLVRKIA